MLSDPQIGLSQGEIERRINARMIGQIPPNMTVVMRELVKAVADVIDQNNLQIGKQLRAANIDLP